MAKLRLSVEEWQSLLKAADVYADEYPYGPCLDTAMTSIRNLLADVAAARAKVGDGRSAHVHDCATAGCGKTAEEREVEQDAQPKALIRVLLDLASAEFGAFLLVARLEDGQVAVVGADENGLLRKDALRAVKEWATREEQKLS